MVLWLGMELGHMKSRVKLIAIQLSRNKLRQEVYIYCICLQAAYFRTVRRAVMPSATVGKINVDLALHWPHKHRGLLNSHEQIIIHRHLYSIGY